ncbi:interactor of HORMAD1 protein 1 isoform X1 [Thunnus albacares]|uniref:interactor of HORMAD1 protein 1 isoform X1 n=1 Tax=Thunnus albacares TaxID=8236 RepID=UPI001CF63319|nr:interactor of HORMAD1 protein 1 isoform X1 [Thunnus albacares]
MNHVRNIKEMLSIPTGSRWLANTNVATSGYSSCTDSQFFFGSQFWPENSQGTSQDMSLSSRTSQQSSQEGSDPKFSNSYHTKPLLFGEFKDKAKAFGLLDKFEEDKKKAKEKTDSDILAKECLNIQETLNNIQQLVAGTEKNTAVCQTVLEKFNNFASTSQNNLSSLQSDISQQFETLLNKVNSQKEVMTELEERVQKSGDTTAELASSVKSLKNSLECLRQEQERERSMLEEALKLLNALVLEHSVKPSPGKVMDSASQTSPAQDNKLEGTQFTSTSYNLEHNLVEVPPQDSSCIIGKRKSTLGGIRRRRKKRPLVLSQRSKRIVSDEISQPVMNRHKQQKVSRPLCELHDQNRVTSRDSFKPDCLMPLNRETRSSKAAGCFITPLSCWSQDSTSSMCLTGFESKTETPVKPESFWQLFDMDCDFDIGF